MKAPEASLAKPKEAPALNAGPTKEQPKLPATKPCPPMPASLASIGFSAEVYASLWETPQLKTVKKKKPTSKTTEKPKPGKPSYDFSFLDTVVLEDESDDYDIPIFDDCNEVRRKIRAFFKEHGKIVTQKRFLEACGGINNRTYTAFMSKTGAGAGAESGMYYGGYVFFEKLRVHERKPKGKKRLDNESM